MDAPPLLPVASYQVCFYAVISLHCEDTIIWITTKDSTGYYSEFPGGSGQVDVPQIVLVGYSSPAILIGFIFSLCLKVLPLPLGLRRTQGINIISRSNSFIISAACHVSTLRQVHSPSSKPTLMTLDNNAELEGTAGYWGHNATLAISAIVDQHSELQSLTRRANVALGCSTTLSEQARSTAPAENIPNAETRASDENGAIIDEQTTQPLLSSLPTCRANSSFMDPDQGIIVASVDGRQGVVDDKADTESQRIISLSSTNGDHNRYAVRSLGAGDAEDRLQATRSLEDGSVSEEDDMQLRVRISRSRTLWGVLCMPEEFYREFEELEGGAELEHLSFGIEQHCVVAPETGHFYA